MQHRKLNARPHRPAMRFFAIGVLLAGAAVACSEPSSQVETGLDPGAKANTTTAMPTQTSSPSAAPTYTSECASSTPALEGAAPPDARVCVKVSLSKVGLRQGETASGAVTIVNRSADPVDISHPSGCAIWYGLYRDGQFVGGGPEFCEAVGMPDILEPQGSKSWPFTVDTNFGADIEGANLEPGTYIAAAGVNVGPFTGRNFDNIWFAPPSPPFTVSSS